MISISAIIRRDIVSVSPRRSVASAAREMLRHDADYALVGRDGRFDGVLTSRAVTNHGDRQMVGACPLEPIAVMSSGTSLGDALRVMEERQAQYLVAVDDNGQPEGTADHGVIVSYLYQKLIELSSSLGPDIIERSQMERALEVSNETFVSIVEKNPVGLVVAGLDGIIQFVNMAARIFLGCREKDIVGSLFSLPLAAGGAARLVIVRISGGPGIGEMCLEKTEWHGKLAYLILIRDVTDGDPKPSLGRVDDAVLSRNFIWKVGADRKIISVNPNLSRLFQLTHGSELRPGMPLLDSLPGKLREFWGNCISRGLSGEEFREENRFDFGNVVFDTEIQSLPERGEDGAAAVSFVFGMSDAGTLFSESLYRTRNIYTTVFESTSTALMVLEADTTICQANAEFERLTGYSKEEIIGRMSLARVVHPDDAERMQKYHYVRRIDPGLAPASYEHRIIDRQGQVKNVMASITMIPGTGRSIASLQDISYRKRIEEERESTISLLRFINSTGDKLELVKLFATFLKHWSCCGAVEVRLREGAAFPLFTEAGCVEENGNGDGVLCEFDENGKLRCGGKGEKAACLYGAVMNREYDASDPCFTKYGSFWTNVMSEVSALITRPPEECHRCKCRGFESVAFIPIRLGGETLGAFQFYDRRKGMFNAELIAAFERFAGNAASSFAKIRAEEEKERFRAQLIHSERIAAVGTLASGVAHEFNNMLQLMRGRAEYARVTGDPDDVRKALDVVLETSDRAAGIIKSLLNFSRRDDGGRGICSVAELVEAVLSLVQVKLRKNNISVERNYGEVPLVVVNRGELQQVFLNLVINAQDAMLGRSGTLRIDIAQAGRFVEVRFADTGMGIPEENLRRIFQPFFTTKGALGGSSTPGTGLGLHVAYGIIRRHGGSIGVESEPGGGAVFAVRLPIGKGSSAGENGQAPA